MSYPTVFKRQLKSNYNVLLQQLDGLTHTDSLLQPPFRGNSLNWVLGHIVAHRNFMLVALGRDSLWTDAENTMYNTDSEPITGPESPHFTLERLLADLQTAHEQLLEAVEAMTEADLATPHDERLTVQDRIVGLTWHEAYHTGQTEYLRQLAGKNDKVI